MPPKKGKGRGRGQSQEQQSGGQGRGRDRGKDESGSARGRGRGRGPAEASEGKGHPKESGRRGYVEESGRRGYAEESGRRGHAEESGRRGYAEASAGRGYAEASGGRGYAEASGGRGYAEASGGRGDAEASGPQTRMLPSAAAKGEEPRATSEQKAVARPQQDVLLKEMTGLSLKPTPSDASKRKFPMAKRPGYGKLGRQIALLANYFRLKFKDICVYHYDIDIAELGKGNKPGSSLMSQGRTVKEDIKKKVAHVEHQQKRNMGKAKCREIISRMLLRDEFKNYSPVYDGQKNIFTSAPLPIQEEKDFDVPVDMEGRTKTFRVTVKPVKKEDNTNVISLEPLREMLCGRSQEIPQEVLLVFDTIMNHRKPPLTQVQARSSFFSYSEAGRDPLGHGLEIWYGYNQSVRLTEQGPVVVINLAAKAFHKSGPVIDYVNEVLNTDVTRLSRLENYHIADLTKVLKGVRVEVTHLSYPRKYRIKGVSRLGARELTFDMDGRRMSIADYFAQKYRRLTYPFLPCLHMQSNNNTTYIPMENCKVVEGQPKVGKLTGEETSQMIRRTAIPPKERFDRILDYARNVDRISGEFMHPFGLLMEVTLTRVNGRVLTAPALAYQDGHSCQPDPKGTWRIDDGKKFLKATQVETWMLMSFANERFCGMDKLRYFCDLLVNAGRKCGMRLNPPAEIKIFNRNTSTEKAITYAKGIKAEFAIVVLSPKDNVHSYEEVKFLADFRFNLVTQCILDKTVGRINAQITTNVCLKLNVKLGGINHVLLQSRQIFKEPVIIFGADAIHWPRDYGYPSIASVVGSLNPTASRYALTCRLQKNIKEGKISQEIIREMEDIVYRILSVFESAVGRRPNKIIFFRDGVSEGQFTAALDNEVSSIQAASMRRYNIYLPITYIIVQKRHQTRLRPQDPRDGVGRGGNVPPGTTVDTTITHPSFFDFFVCSHEGIQGTSKPAHYTVLHDDNGFTADSLQELSYFLCHLYVRCNRSVSIPAPVLYADLAAERAKKYADLYVERETASTSSSGSGQRDLPPHVVQAIESMQSFENNMFYV